MPSRRRHCSNWRRWCGWCSLQALLPLPGPLLFHLGPRLQVHQRVAADACSLSSTSTSQPLLILALLLDGASVVAARHGRGRHGPLSQDHLQEVDPMRKVALDFLQGPPERPVAPMVLLSSRRTRVHELADLRHEVPKRTWMRLNALLCEVAEPASQGGGTQPLTPGATALAGDAGQRGPPANAPTTTALHPGEHPGRAQLHRWQGRPPAG